MVMGAVDTAAAGDQRLTLDLDYLEARNGYVDLPEPTVPGPIGVRLGGDDGIDGLWPSIWGPVVPYAGVGLSKINLAFQLETGELVMEKEHDFTRARLIAGVGYDATRHVSLGLEYLAVRAQRRRREPGVRYPVYGPLPQLQGTVQILTGGKPHPVPRKTAASVRSRSCGIAAFMACLLLNGAAWSQAWSY